MPWYNKYDYVEVSTYDQETNQFSLKWRDDFDTFDESRWSYEEGTRDYFSSTIYPDQVSIEAGKLVLTMEKEEKESLVPTE